MATMTRFSFGALALCLAAAASGLAFGCSSNGGNGGFSGGAGGEAGDAGEDSTSGGSKASAGTSSLGGRPSIPAATYESCGDLGFEYAGGACTKACSPVTCKCDPFNSSYTGCHPERGCLTAVDCALACELDLGDVVSCIAEYAPCAGDQDCKTGRCVGGDATRPGDCKPGTSGLRLSRRG